MVPVPRMTEPRCGWRAGVLLGATLAVAPLHAEPRVSFAAPVPQGWRVDLVDLDGPSFVIDGAAAAARRVGPGPAGTVWEIETQPARATRLVVRDGDRDVLALRLGVDAAVDAPFNEWNIYHVMLAYFRNGDASNDRAGMRRWVHRNYAGGDLQGVRDKAAYLASLGVNAVWLSPLFASETSHGYDVLNYYRVADAVSVPRDPLAAMGVYQETVDALRAVGVRVILDLPLDYAAGAYERRDGDPKRLRPKTTAAIQEAEKLWESWNVGFRYWNFADADTREFLRDVGRYWLTTGRADGYRLDYVRGVPHDFWAEFYAEMKKARPDAFLFGEGWQDAAAPMPNAQDIATYYQPVDGLGAQFDGLLGYPLQMVMTDAFARGTGSAADLERWLQLTAALYGPTGRPVYFLDNHDVSRFMSWTTDDGEKRLLAAVGFMASLSSPIVLFYGTETGLAGGRPQLGFTDLGRIPMPWNSLNDTLVERVGGILRTRSRWPALTRGGRLPVLSTGEVLVMRKRHPEGDVLVGVNLSGQERLVRFRAADSGEADRPWHPLLGETAPTAAGPGELAWVLPPWSTSWATGRRDP